jgi:hypothetical protein
MCNNSEFRATIKNPFPIPPNIFVISIICHDLVKANVKGTKHKIMNPKAVVNFLPILSANFPQINWPNAINPEKTAEYTATCHVVGETL